MRSKQSKNKTLVTSAELKNLSPFARDIAEGLIDAIDFIQGEGHARVTEIELPEPAPIYQSKDVARIRKQLGMTQVRFARLVNVSTTSVENWERGIKSPGPASCRLLQLISNKKAMVSFVQYARYKPAARSSKMDSFKEGRNGR